MIDISIIILSCFLWRVRGGLRFWGHKAPLNKIWYAVFLEAYSCLYFGYCLENLIVGFVASYTSYQLYGWGMYVGRLLSGGTLDPEKDKECELIDDLLYPLHITLKGTKYYLFQYPKLFGFIGTCLTGLIISFICGLYLGNLWFMLSGLSMGLTYWLSGQLNKLVDDGKYGWKWAEWLDGFVKGLILVAVL